MTKVECDHCKVAQRSSANPSGWATVYLYARRTRPGHLGDPGHLDLCPACAAKAGLVSA